MQTFRKDDARVAIATEAASLRWLAAAGGAPVVELLNVGGTWLETRYMRERSASPSAAAEFGARLAETHAAGAEWWGQAPPGIDEMTLAGLPLPTTNTPRFGSFGEFFAEFRLLPYFRMARAFSPEAARVVAAAIDVIASGACDSPQPELVQTEAARVHGDLWGGNVLWAPEGVLIDPAAHGGHAETDLASLSVFGAPHLALILHGYNEASPLADGWQARLPVHKFHMWLTHVALFGASYVRQAASTAQEIVRTFGKQL